MKRLAELMALAIEHTKHPAHSAQWFIYYSGHVNGISIHFYPQGYSEEDDFITFDEYLESEKAIESACHFFETHLPSKL